MICEVFGVKHELPLRLFDVVWAVKHQSYLRQRQHAHHQGVVPELLVVVHQVGDVL